MYKVNLKRLGLMVLYASAVGVIVVFSIILVLMLPKIVEWFFNF